jgi:hypothetical protein
MIPYPCMFREIYPVDHSCQHQSANLLPLANLEPLTAGLRNWRANPTPPINARICKTHSVSRNTDFIDATTIKHWEVRANISLSQSLFFPASPQTGFSESFVAVFVVVLRHLPKWAWHPPRATHTFTFTHTHTHTHTHIHMLTPMSHTQRRSLLVTVDVSNRGGS